MSLADTLRMVDAVLALPLTVACVFCIIDARTWDQRLRFLALLGYAVLTIGGHLSALGEPMSWRLPALLAATVVAVIGTGVYVARAQREA